jgi:ABC-type Fe3+/spermidine/putrescine transport system ATPase subunit
MAAEPLWQLHALSLAPGRLREVSLTIERGVTAVIGWSGAGKTSLLNVLAGFEKADAGRITGAPRVAWVPQNGGLWPHCTVREHLEIARASALGIDGILTAFDLGKRAAARPHELSEGEQSRLAVARALAAEAEVLVMDEPLVHVDPAREGKYWRVIRKHLTATGASLVFATHAPEAALGEATRAICLREGRVLHTGPIASLYAQPPSAELMSFLGPGNWFTPEEAQVWLGVEITTARCYRPEEVEIVPAEEGEFVIESARFRGAFAEVELRSQTESESRQFVHRPRGPALTAGMRAEVRVNRP